MTRRRLFLAVAPPLLALALLAELWIGAAAIPLSEVAGALLTLDAETYEQSVVLHQRLPRALIAVYVGAVTAVGGAVLQGLVRNPLASPSTLGINAGAALSVVAGALLFDLGTAAQGVAALAGGGAGFAACVLVARLAGRDRDPRGLSLILAGALVSMLLVGMTNALLLSDPARRTEFLGWVAGTLTHVYADRLAAFWWIGALSLLVLALLARPLTLVLLGAEKAASAGVEVGRVSRLALAAALLGCGSAVAICGPVGFVGLVVPHLVRPLVGSGLTLALPACALAGAIVCLLADLVAQTAFHPYVLHTGLVTDLLGGLVFLVIVKRFYLSPGKTA
ncbi:FecCD family ABC transporter permease [Azospirillum agricola]|uniref:FecCD family ABC transporter permease n=1 Tax=Azospirillum agricola TaxID=1720247 RepID=UPI000A0F17A2|nr:iron ABC transporter permease [Azospirillum agricola]SMH46561.1 iron complex transport system permease protein [Azospirillum lipoferum]